MGSAGTIVRALAGDRDRVAAFARAAPFTVDARRAYGDPAAENALVHGENLEAMRRLAGAGFRGRFRCIYLDPPYNSGRRFQEYDDALAPRAWRTMIADRLRAAAPLLAADGAIFAEIDDTELGPLQVAMDAVFGRDNRIATITVVRSAATGHKAANRGPVNVTDYVLAYAADRAKWRCNPTVRERAGYDRAYATWLENPGDAPDVWRFRPLAAKARAVLGAGASRAEVEAYALANAAHVVRLAQPRYEAVSHEARALIDRSRLEPTAVLRLVRPGHKDLVLRGGNRVLFLSDKVVARGGRAVIVEPLTNVWDDVPFPGDRPRGRRAVRPQQEAREAHRADPGDGHRRRRLGARRVPR